MPSILLGGSADWPDWLNPITEERWQHILREHGPDSISAKPHFKKDTDIGNAIFDTITKGRVSLDKPVKKQWRHVVNGQEIVVDVVKHGDSWYISNAYPNE